jgi:hypothetical protein
MYVVQRNIESRPQNHRCCGKAINITYSESMSVVLVIQHAKRMGRIMSSVACMPLHYFSTVSHKRHDFRGKVLFNIKRVFFSLLLSSEKFIIIIRIQRDANIKVYRSQSISHYCLILIWPEFSPQIFGKRWQWISWKSVQWEPSCSIRTGG